MKNIKNLCYLFLITILFVSCSKNKEEDILDSNTKISEVQDSRIYLKSQIQKIKTEINKSKKEDGGINSRLSIKVLEKGKIKTQEKKLVDLTFKLAGLKSGYDATFTNYTFVDKNNNNGYNMIVAEGYCEIKKVNIKLGLNLSEDNSTSIIQYKLLPGGSTLVCEGCRRGCSPRRRANGDGYCTDCEITNSNCKKIESI